jgi:cyanophycinase
MPRGAALVGQGGRRGAVLPDPPFGSSREEVVQQSHASTLPRPSVTVVQVFLIGGGWSDERAEDMFGGFVAAAAARADGRLPRIVLVVMGTDADSLEYHEKYVHALGLVQGHELVIERITEGEVLDPAVLDGIDGLFVGGGPTPEYHASLAPAYDVIRELVSDGLPYAGFSAGAAIAATTAIIGGWLIDGVPVCPEDSNEELDPVTVVDGIGLVGGAVDVHASQWGNLSRLVAAVETGLVAQGVAIDECTTLGPGRQVTGAGRAWRVTPAPDGAVVSRA